MENNNTNHVENNNTNHAVLYSDGSAYPNPSNSWGSGFHGYTYSSDNLDKKNGDRPNKFIISNIGYIEVDLASKTKHQTVIPTKYINGYGSYNVHGSNNTAELMAVIYSVNELLKLTGGEKISSIRIKSDSAYTLGMVDRIKEGIDWRTQYDKNLEYLAMIADFLNRAKENDVEIITEKVTAHDTSLGNYIADQLALLGRLISSRHNTDVEKLIYTDPKKYWKPDLERHPFLQYKQLFFINDSGTEKPLYAIMNYKKDDEPGKKSHEASFGLVILDEPIEIIEIVKSVYQSYLNSLSLISAVDLNMLFNQNTYMLYELFGKDIFTFNTRGRRYLSVLEEDIVCTEIHPAGLAKKALESLFIYFVNSAFFVS